MKRQAYFVDYCCRCKRTFRHREALADMCSSCYSYDWDKPPKPYTYKEDDETLQGKIH